MTYKALLHLPSVDFSTLICSCFPLLSIFCAAASPTHLKYVNVLYCLKVLCLGICYDLCLECISVLCLSGEFLKSSFFSFFVSPYWHLSNCAITASLHDYLPSSVVSTPPRHTEPIHFCLFIAGHVAGALRVYLVCLTQQTSFFFCPCERIVWG